MTTKGKFVRRRLGQYALFGNVRFLSGAVSGHHFFVFLRSRCQCAATASHRVIESFGRTPAPQSKNPAEAGFLLCGNRAGKPGLEQVSRT